MAAVVLRKVVDFEAANERAAAILLASPERYPGLPQVWGEIIHCKEEKNMSVQFDEGRYKTKIIEQYATESSLKGTRGLVLVFQVLANVTEPDKPVVYRFPRKTTLWVTTKTFQRVLQTLQGLGYRGKTLSGVDPACQDYHSFRDVEGEMECRHETDENGTTWEKWEIARGEIRLRDGSAFEEFDEILRCEQAAGNKPAAEGNGDAVSVRDGITDDDVPF